MNFKYRTTCTPHEYFITGIKNIPKESKRTTLYAMYIPTLVSNSMLEETSRIDWSRVRILLIIILLSFTTNMHGMWKGGIKTIPGP